jgi:SAM-dependent methyltransferase
VTTGQGEPRTGDAFGAALHDYFESDGQRARIHIIERDDGFIDNADTAQYFAAPEQWSKLDRWALEGVDGRVLDIGAGGGRAALLLHERGCDVTALDVSPLAAEVCAKRGVRATFAGTIEEFAATRPAPFDSFVLLGNNLGLLRSADYAPVLLHLLETIARPGAALSGTCLNPYRTDDPLHLAYHERNRAAHRMPCQLRMRVRYRDLATDWWDYLFMSLEELRGLVAPTPWRIEETLEDGPLYAVRMRMR